MERKVSHFRAPRSIPGVLFQVSAALLFRSVHNRAVLYNCVLNTVVTFNYAKRSNIVFR